MPQTIFQVDAFTTEPFRGNPAGVCILDHEPESAWMQNVAMEMNVSETAFVFPGKGIRMIRFYSPESEVDLCGHATLSASHIMYETGIVSQGDDISLSSKAGILKIRRSGGWITMNFPLYTLERMQLNDNFTRVTGKTPLELYRCGKGWTLAVLEIFRR
jgi:PhzF family phenazine biosynthesis protein